MKSGNMSPGRVIPFTLKPVARRQEMKHTTEYLFPDCKHVQSNSPSSKTDVRSLVERFCAAPPVTNFQVKPTICRIVKVLEGGGVL